MKWQSLHVTKGIQPCARNVLTSNWCYRNKLCIMLCRNVSVTVTVLDYNDNRPVLTNTVMTVTTQVPEVCVQNRCSYCSYDMDCTVVWAGWKGAVHSHCWGHCWHWRLCRGCLWGGDRSAVLSITAITISTVAMLLSYHVDRWWKTHHLEPGDWAAHSWVWVTGLWDWTPGLLPHCQGHR